MAETKLSFRGGIEFDLSALTNKGGWSSSNLIRWRRGMVEKIGGWKAVSSQLPGTCRTLHFWSDLTGQTWLAAGTTSNLELVGAVNNIDITPVGYAVGQVSSGGVPFALRIWSLDNFGQNLIAIPSGGSIYVWTPPFTGVRAGLIGPAPRVNQGGFVAADLQIVIAYGCGPLAVPGAGDPMMVRWCDQSDYQVWLASTTNQAGSFRLSRGNRIVGGLQSANAGLLWTDFSLWAMQYIGYPLVFSFREIGENCGLIAQKAAVAAGSIAYWMSDHGFFRIAGGGVEQIPCTVWDFVYKDLDQTNQDKCVAALNFHFSEVWFFFPSLSGGTGEIDSYVKYNMAENLWDCGRLVRTAWTDANRPGAPLGVDGGGLVQQHDVTTDANGAAMTGVFVQSGFVDLGDGGEIILANRVIPDFVWTGSGQNPSLSLTFLIRNFPGDTPTTMGPFTVTPTTEFITLTSLLQDGKTPAVGIRGREIAVRISSDGLGVFWRNGTNRVRSHPDGRL